MLQLFLKCISRDNLAGKGGIYVHEAPSREFHTLSGIINYCKGSRNTNDNSNYSGDLNYNKIMILVMIRNMLI